MPMPCRQGGPAGRRRRPRRKRRGPHRGRRDPRRKSWYPRSFSLVTWNPGYPASGPPKFDFRVCFSSAEYSSRCGEVKQACSGEAFQPRSAGLAGSPGALVPDPRGKAPWGRPALRRISKAGCRACVGTRRRAGRPCRGRRWCPGRLSSWRRRCGPAAAGG